jgi:TM2 domain-containing membrane protein YozV
MKGKIGKCVNAGRQKCVNAGRQKCEIAKFQNRRNNKASERCDICRRIVAAQIVILLIFFLPNAFAQNSDSLVVEYLLERKQFNDILRWTQHRQTLPYYRALAFYNQQQLDSAIYYFDKTPATHPNYLKSRFLTGFAQVFQKRWEAGNQTLGSLKTADTLYRSLQNYELAAVALLRRDTVSFVQRQRQFEGKYFAFSQEEQKLGELYQSVRKFRRKSPVVAGLLSAVVPGSGKMYAGKLGQGIITLIQNVALGFQAYEAYRRDGWKSPRFIVYGGLFTFFYVGNIWGSTLSVHIRRQEFNDKINEQILVNMQLPLRTVFGQ